MSDDEESGCFLLLGLLVVLAAAAVTLYIFHGDLRCLIVDCVLRPWSSFGALPAFHDT